MNKIWREVNNKIWSAVNDRAREKSTWVGVTKFVAGIAGWTVAPGVLEAIGTVGLALWGVVEVVFREHGYISDSVIDNALTAIVVDDRK